MSLMYNIISSADMGSLTSFFHICLCSLYLFSFLSALTKTLKTVLHKHGESGPLCLIPDFSGNVLCFSLFNAMLNIFVKDNPYHIVLFLVSSGVFVMKGY